MMDLFLSMGLSNACLALALALVALAAGAKARRPHLAHLLWLLVFVRLVTPPLVTIPVSALSPPADDAGADARAFVAGAPSALADTAPGSPLLSRLAPIWNRAKPGVAILWLLGSAVALVWSLVRVYRFGRLLAGQSEGAPPELQREAERLARRLGLATTPAIRTVSAHLSPLVWWVGGRVRIFIPRALLDQMDAHDWQWILAHELAHVRRRDHLVRWVEWLACVGFWWNPVLWWAQRNLRAMEEICCDDLVLSRLQPQPKSYADSLLSAVEFLARPAVRAPAMASEINSGGSLERRFRMMVSSKPNRSRSRWLRMGVLACALMVLPLGLASAQDYGAVAKRLKEAVKQGEITPLQAEAMMAALKKEPGTDQNRADLAPIWEKLQAQVRAGKLTKEQARDKMMALRAEAAQKDSKDNKTVKKDVTGKDQDLDKTTAYLMKLKEDLAAAVAAGKISKEDAFKKYETTKRNILEKEAGGAKDTREKAAVKRDLKDRPVIKKDIKDEPEPPVKKDRDSDKAPAGPTKVKKDPEATVKADKIGTKDPVKKPEAGKKDAPAKDIKKTPAAQPDYDAIGRELKAAVQAGKLTKEEAKAKWEALKKEAAGNRGKNSTTR